MNRLHKYIFFCLLFFLFSVFVFNQPTGFGQIKVKKISLIIIKKRKYVSIYDLIQKTDLDHLFAVLTQRGKLYYKSHSAIYQVGVSAILIDGLIIKSDYPVIRHNGDILLPAAMFYELMDHFFPLYILKEQRGVVVFNKQKKAVSVKIAAKKKKTKNFTKIKEKIAFIIIDAGHGGKDPGALGGRTKEKIIVLNIAKKLSAYLKRNMRGIKVKMSRRNDRFVELGKRTEIANKMLKKNTNGIFVSLHANASLSPRISGYETYFLSQNPTNEGARSTAALENNVIVLENKKSRKSYSDIDFVEALMLTNQIQKESSMLAYAIQGNMEKKLRRFKSRGVKKADFFVLRGALMPAVLVEVGYMTNKKELRYLETKKYQYKVSASIGKGILGFIKKYNKFLKK